MQAKVLSNTKLADRTQKITLSRPAGYTYRPGDYLTIPFAGVKRYLSIVSSPHEPQLELTVRTSDSPFKQYLMNLEQDQTVELSAAKGTLGYVAGDASSLVVLAGGIGITPFVSIVRYLAQQSTNEVPPLTILHANRYASEAAYAGELTKLARLKPWLTYKTFFSQEPYSNRITTADVAEAINDHPDCTLLIAGSHQFISGMYDHLSQLGVAPDRVSAEVFCGYCSEHECCCDHITYGVACAH